MITEATTKSLATANWRTSSRSAATNCVELAALGQHVAVRDSKDRSGPVLLFGRTTWSDFLASLKAGEFDLS